MKSVCDFANPEKNNGFQNYAAYTSSALAFKRLHKLNFNTKELIVICLSEKTAFDSSLDNFKIELSNEGVDESNLWFINRYDLNQ